MLSRLRRRYEDFWGTALIAVLMAAVFLLFGFAELIQFETSDFSRNMPATVLWLCVSLIVMGFALLVGVIFPYWGGILVAVCVIPFIISSHFHPVYLFLGILLFLIGLRLFFAGRYLKIKKDTPDYATLNAYLRKK